jgi:uncharacterized membrane protein
MLKMKDSACINAPVEKVWEVLSNLEKISDWSEEIKSAECVGDHKRGLHAQRKCLLSNNVIITERIVSWNEGSSFTYEGFDIPMIASAKNTWTVKSDKGQTLLTTESEASIKGGYLGLILEPLIKLVSKRMSRKTLSAFKFLVENGKPYDGKHSSLPRVSSVC